MKFKIGDKVKIINNNSCSCNEIGDVGIIIDIDEDDLIPYRVLVEGRNVLQNFHQSTDIELYEDKKTIENSEPLKALRYNENKLKWGLLDYFSIEEIIKVLEYGTKEYGKDNWQLGLDNTEILESAQRHLSSLFKGEELDSKSNLPHASHIMANLMFYLYNKRKEK